MNGFLKSLFVVTALVVYQLPAFGQNPGVDPKKEYLCYSSVEELYDTGNPYPMFFDISSQKANGSRDLREARGGDAPVVASCETSDELGLISCAWYYSPDPSFKEFSVYTVQVNEVKTVIKYGVTYSYIPGQLKQLTNVFPPSGADTAPQFCKIK